jgi:signal transduction histidine kinase
VKTYKYHLFHFHNTRKIFPFAFLFLFLISSVSLTQQPFDTLEQKLRTVSGKEKVDLLNKLADVKNRTSIVEPSEYADQALKLALKINYIYGEAVAMRNIGFNYYRKNDLVKAEPEFKKALEIFLQLKDSFQLCETYNQFGLLYWKKDQFIPAYQYFRTSLKIAKTKQLKKQESQALNYIGLIYWKWSEFSSSLDYFTQALAIKETLHDDFETGITLNNIANIYNEIDRPDDAIIYASRCSLLAKKYPNKYVLGRALNNLGVSYFKKGEYDKSIEFQNEALLIKSESSDISGQAFSMSDLGEVYLAKKNTKKASEYFLNALKLWHFLDDSYGISKTTFNLGKLYLIEGSLDKAETYFTSSLNEAKDHQNKKNIALAYQALSGLYELKKDDRQALVYHKLYSVYSDSLASILTSDKIAELRVFKEIDEKEKEVELLIKEKKIQALEIEKHEATNKIFLLITISGIGIFLLLIFRFVKIRRLKFLLEEKNQAISQKSKELEEANAAKDKFFSIIAHDLKSPFTGLLGYSEILSEEFDTMDREEKLKTVGFLKNLIERVYTLIENLLDWSRIQTDRIELSPEAIDLITEVPEILNLLKANADKKQITLSNNINESLTVFADKYSFRSIMQNLISNAVKFTKPNGEVKISAKDRNNFVEIFVSDNGIGMLPELLKRIFKIETRHTTKGTADEAGTGLGLLLCKELAEKNGGGIAIESHVGIGTTICITLPKANKNLSFSLNEVN